MIFCNFRIAVLSDVNDIVALVNCAYRPAIRNVSWTNESDWVEGERTSAKQVIQLLLRANSVVLIAEMNAEIVGCIHLEKNGASCHIGMLAVLPNQQQSGLGKCLLAHAENYAKEKFSANRLAMEVVTSRIELIDFYLRRGYQRTGVLHDYPVRAGVGNPKVANLKIEMLEKRMQ